MEVMDIRTGELVEIVEKDENGNLTIAKEACELIEFAETQMKEFTKAYKEYRKRLCEAMETFGVDKIDAPRFVSTYKDGYWKKGGIDAELLKEKYPDIYEEVRKEDTWVNPTVQVRMRG